MARGASLVYFRQENYSAECCLASAQGSHMLLKIRPGGWLICLCAPTSWLHASNLFRHTLLPSFIPPQVRADISAVCRGDLSVSLESPSGTVSMLLDTRPNDASTDGLKNWTLMSVHCWEEQPRGLWTLRVRAKDSSVPSFVLVYVPSRRSSSVIIKHAWVLTAANTRSCSRCSY